MTARPPVCTQIHSKARVKSGTYGGSSAASGDAESRRVLLGDGKARVPSVASAAAGCGGGFGSAGGAAGFAASFAGGGRAGAGAPPLYPGHHGRSLLASVRATPRTPAGSLPLRARRATRLTTNLSCSETGRTSGPSVAMFDLSASPAICMICFERRPPRIPAASSSWYTERYASSFLPMCVRTVCSSWKRARRRSAARLERRMAAAPQRKRQLESSMERSLPAGAGPVGKWDAREEWVASECRRSLLGSPPRYQFCVMFSVETTRASASRCSPAAQSTAE